ncbi:MAG TPA: NosD domain-containing protein [Gemmatimonadales bacterium]|nr:NosD domain-containing protein [Gemmatimonadales bacterium]
MSFAARVIVVASAALAAAAPRGPAQPRPPTVVLRPGIVITRSVRIAPRTYRLAAPASLDSALVTIRGDDVTVDFAGARLAGLATEADPDRAQGVAIRVDGGRNVRILHATIRGYRVGILARGTRGLELGGVDASYGWKPRLFSLVEHESLVDWQSYHHDEHDEWLRWGAAFYLEDVRGGAVRGCRAGQGANGLMLVRTDSLEVADDDFSFNSGTGIALYRSSWNRIVHNRIDYDIRGYSHRYYRRGQDSAGLLMYEQSSHNVVAYNSITHGGDGLFLWAGQSTMDSGAGGANDNLFFGNDVSWAAANGIEATFSRNDFVANRSSGSEYGVWGGYSHDTRIVGNDLVGNRIGIAIEHGQDNLIGWNRIADGTTGVSLWADTVTDTSWGYPKHRDVRSRGYRVTNDLFRRLRVGLRSRQTAGLVQTWNRWMDVDSATVLRDTDGYQASEDATAREVTSDSGVPRPPAEYADLAPATAPGDTAVPGSPLAARDRSAILVDEWGPYDWRSPKLWPADSTRGSPLRLVTLGPAGRWRVATRRGVAAVAPTSGRIGDTIAVTPAAGPGADWELTLEYRGGATVSPRGSARAAGEAYRFTYGRFEPAQDWAMRFFAWTDSADPRTRPAAFAALLAGPPLLERRAPRLDLEWYRPQIEGLPQERWAMEATATVTLPAGGYTLRAISDDAVRVWVDGRLAIDDWAPHESVVDGAALTGGRHELRVDYYQVDGWVELRLDIVRGIETSRGTAGPH